MEPLEIIKCSAAYVSGYENIPQQAQKRAKQLCWEYNRTLPEEEEKRRAILQQLLGTCSPMTGIEPDFHCDYGFNIHTHGLAVINYNCVILNTSPVNIGAGAFIAPGSVIGAGSVVTHDIPAGVIAAGVPCRVLRPITEQDKIDPEKIAF